MTIICLLWVAGCGSTEEPVSPGDSVDWMIANTSNYLTDSQWRRAELEASLWRPELPYASKRLGGYGLGESGWDLLPELKSFRDEAAPTDRTAWLALGERVFWEMPMRSDAYLEWASEQPEAWADLGFETDASGNLRGVVSFVDTRGNDRKGATCAFCHAQGGVAGVASRDLDLGKGRSLWATAHGFDGSEYAEWGPGNVDVTDDGVVDALRIPDLFGVAHQSHLNRSGAVKIESPASLAIRFETQYIVGHNMEARPNRVLTWALAMYVLSLTESPTVDDQHPGFKVFERQCASCHLVDQGFAGPLIPADALESDPQAAYSVFRGTSFYKTPSLIGASQGGPYLHDGSIPDLESLVESHPSASGLGATQKADLVDFLNTL